MRTRIFQVDAFASRRFEGNPAAVMPLDEFLSDATLQAIAAGCDRNFARQRSL